MEEYQEKMHHDVFICYETTTGSAFAKNVKDALLKMFINAFVAKYDIPKNVKDEAKYRYEKLEKTDLFVIIMTTLAVSHSSEVKKEIDKAKKLDKSILLTIDSKVDINKLYQQFPELEKHQRCIFNDKSELAKIVTDHFDSLEISGNFVFKECGGNGDG